MAEQGHSMIRGYI